MGVLNKRIVLLFDALASSPDGLTIHEIGAILKMDADYERPRINEVIRGLRLRLGEFNADPDDQVHGYTVPVVRDGFEYRYVLSANREQGEQWQDTRLQTVLSRLEVDLAYWKSFAAVNDEASNEGKIARIFVRHYSRLYEDVQLIKDDVIN